MSSRSVLLAAALGLAQTLAASLAVALAGPAALAQTGERERAEALVQEGLGKARAGKFKDAVKDFEDAFKLYPNAEILHNVARAREELGQLADAHAAFAKALEMDPAYTFAEDARKRISSLEAKLRKSHGLVHVRSIPSQVEVKLMQGERTVASHLVTPVSRWVAAGTLEVRGEKTGFERGSLGADVKAGEDLDLELVLVPVVTKGFLTVTSNVDGAEITLNGRSFGKTPLAATPYPAGSYTLRVEKPGLTAFETVLLIEPDKVSNVAAELLDPEAIARKKKKEDGGGNRGVVAGILLGTGGGLGLVAGIFQLAAADAAKDANAVPNSGLPEDDKKFNELADRAESLQSIAVATGVVALGAVGTGLWFLFADDGEEEATGATTFAPAVAPLPGGAAAFAVVRF